MSQILKIEGGELSDYYSLALYFGYDGILEIPCLLGGVSLRNRNSVTVIKQLSLFRFKN
jgi:hypothetical protein